MKLLLISVRSDFGGGPRHVDQLIEELSRCNVEIYAAYPQNGDPYGKKWDASPYVKGRFYLPYRSFSIRSLLRLKNYIEENNIDIIHSHGNGAGIYSRLLKVIGVRSKIVHTFHGVTNNYSCVIKKWVNLLLGKFLCRFTDHFICVSKGEFDLALSMNFLSPSCSSVVYNGVEDVSTTVSDVSDQFYVVTLSRFDYQKNMDMAFKIASELKNENIHFVWVGDGPDYNRLKEKAIQEKLKVEFTGFSKEPLKYLKSASVYLSTSRFEGLPYALIEASCVALPIIASDVVGNNEIVKNGENGYLFKNVEDAVDRIKYLFLNKAVREEMSARSRVLFEKSFSMKKMMDGLMNVYNHV